MTKLMPSLDKNATNESSRMAQSFAAKIQLETADLGLFLIIGREGSLDNLVASVGGKIVFRLPGRRKLLAIIRTAMFSEIQRHPDVTLIGPVAVDQQRFAHFAALIRLEPEQPPTLSEDIKSAGKVRKQTRPKKRPDKKGQDKPHSNKLRRKK